MAKVLVGLSGGVDSAVAAALLIEQGHEVAAGYMKNWINDEGIPGDCPWQQDIEDAHAVCRTLGIELRVIDLIDSYRGRIVDYLIEGYRSGITPNPDVWCNREMKFGVFLDYALAQGFEFVGTGHYARRRDLTDGSAGHPARRGSQQGPELFPRVDDAAPGGARAVSHRRDAQAARCERSPGVSICRSPKKRTARAFVSSAR
jgi:tRNA U34 2-thiouridine synthase MnmA/TrmU